MKAHTPGPWTIIKGTRFARIEAGPVLIHGNDRNLANIALIASAPDLLAALEDITAAFQDFRDMEGLEERPEVEAALLAIARARGE
jgi:hypothetical protein